MIKKEDLKVGLQIIHVPQYIQQTNRMPIPNGYLVFPEVEIGFVTSWRTDIIFCRFFWRRSPQLRTIANSEGCSAENLFVVKYFNDDTVEHLISKMRGDPLYYGWFEQKRSDDNV